MNQLQKARMLFASAVTLCGATIVYVHWSKENARAEMHRAVLQDRERERAERAQARKKAQNEL